MPVTSSKIVFFGTPPLAVESLRSLLDSGRNISLVVTQPDRPVGRGQKVAKTAVKVFAEEHGIPVVQPKKMKDPEFWERLKKSGSKLFVVTAYGRILPREVLEIPDMTLNVHASLLPRYRGAAPIARAILAGESVTGVSIMKLALEMDAGDYCLQTEVDILPNETTGELTQRLAKVGGKAIVEALNLIDGGGEKFISQDVSQVMFAPPIKAEEAKIDWNRPARQIHNHVRAFNPWPGAVTSDGAQKIKIHRTLLTGESTAAHSPGTVRATKHQVWVAAQDEWLEVLEIQREGRARQPVASFLPGYPVREGMLWV